MTRVKFDSSFKVILLIFSMYVVSQLLIGGTSVIISWDVLGYYLYLPYGLIENDLTFSDLSHLTSIVDQYDNTATLYQLTDVGNGNRIIKYPMGMAIMNLPFFIIGHLSALLLGYPADGFSAPYEKMMLIANWFYTLLGFWFLRKLLLSFFNTNTTSIVLILIFIGTNYYYLVINQAGLSHGYLFALYSIGIYLTHLWHKEPTIKKSILLGLLIGLMIITRPIEIFFLLIVIFWNVHSFKGFISKYKKLLANDLYKLVLFSLSIILVGSLQLIYWKLITGNWFFYSYDNPGEGFDFSSPHTIDFLFSFRKGWLVYTPIMIFAIMGLFYTRRRKYVFGMGLILFFILNLWVVSSWTCWWYAGSFSQRSVIQSYPVMAMGLGTLLTELKGRSILKTSLLVLSSLFIILNLFQTWQINKGIISDSRMTRDYYFKVFGKTYIPKNAKDLLLVERAAENKTHPKKMHLYNNGNIAASFDTLSVSYNEEFKNITSSTFAKLTSKDHIWIKISGNAIIDSLGSNEGFLIVTTFSHDRQNYSYLTWGFNEMNACEEDSNKADFSFWYLTPEVRTLNDEFTCYIWNRAKSSFRIVDLKIKTFERLE